MKGGARHCALTKSVLDAFRNGQGRPHLKLAKGEVVHMHKALALDAGHIDKRQKAIKELCFTKNTHASLSATLAGRLA